MTRLVVRSRAAVFGALLGIGVVLGSVHGFTQGLGYFAGSGAMLTTGGAVTVDSLTFNNANPDVMLSRGAANVLLLADGDRLALGGVTASEVSLARAGTELRIVFGDASDYAPVRASQFAVEGVGANPFIRSGTGSPEGVVAAPNGSVFLRGDATGSLYVKQTGGGSNTGWVVK